MSVQQNLVVGGYIRITKELVTKPPTPPEGEAYLYLQDNGASPGKTQLMVKFADGTAQQLAIQN